MGEYAKNICENCNSHMTVDVIWRMCYDCQSPWTHGDIEENYWRDKIAREIEGRCSCPEEAFLEQGFHSCDNTRFADFVRRKKRRGE